MYSSPRITYQVAFTAYYGDAIRATHRILPLWPWLVYFRLLRRMWMSRASIDLELHDLLTTKPRLRQHTLDSKAQNSIRVTRHHALVRNRLEPARVARVTMIGLLVFFAASHMHLLGVDNHHKIAAVKVRAERWLVLPAQQCRDLCR